jgi:hypothetical protein
VPGIFEAPSIQFLEVPEIFEAPSIQLLEAPEIFEAPSIQLLAHLLTDLLGLDLGTVIIDVPRGGCPVPINPTHNSFSVSSDFSR